MRKTNTRQKYFLYARKSSESEDRQVQSIESQVSRLTELARLEGLTVVEVFEESKTAKEALVRPLFMNMIQRIQKGEADGILCWELNRLARNFIDGGQIIDLLQRSVIAEIRTFQSTHLPTDNILILAVHFGMANQFIIDLKRNCLRGMEDKAKAGWLPSKAPLGYLNDKADRTIVIDPERYAIVREMWERMLTGHYTPNQIRLYANNTRGLRTPKSKREGGGPLSKGAIYKLFTNSFYMGIFSWAGKEYAGKHKAIVSYDEFDKVQILLGKKGRPRSKTHEFAYTGMIRCGMCGSMITASEKTKVSKKTGELKNYVYYHCTKKNKQVPCVGQLPITVQELEAQILTHLQEISISPGIYEWAIATMEQNRSQKVQAEKELRENQLRTIKAIQNELDNLTRMRYRDLIDDDGYTRERDVLQGKLLRLKAASSQPLEDPDRQLREGYLFALNAEGEFVKGDLQSKKYILAKFGSNFLLKDKRLLFTKHEWIQQVFDSTKVLPMEFKPLEPKKTYTLQGKKSPFYNKLSDGDPT